MAYSFEVVEAGTQEVITDIEGYGEWRRTYLICLGLETQSRFTSYVGTLWNETDNRPVPMWDGSLRFLTNDEDTARKWFKTMMYPRATA